VSDRITRYPAYLYTSLPLVVVGSVDLSGRRVDSSQGLAAELDSSAVGIVVCPSSRGAVLQQLRGTSFGMT
jgi:hypothetical protein